ncbi:MAG TPA: hypothetical protein VLZ83_17090 [Edaphocola sp.]|nr:hypothetical protein [Edaphocola sp.]
MRFFYIFLLTCLGAPIYSSGQISWTFGGGVIQGAINTNQLNSFAESFNDYHKGVGFKPLNDFKPKMNSLFFSTGFRYFPSEKKSGITYSVLYRFNKYKQKNETTLLQGSGYDINYWAPYHDFLFELGYSIKDRVSLSAVLGLAINFHTIEIWKVYANGDRSMGNENNLPGHYVGLSTPLEYGLSAGIKLNKILIPIRITHSRSFLNVMGTEDEFGVFIDYTKEYKWRSKELPLDYKKWSNERVPPIDNGINSGALYGLRISVGIEYQLNLSK